MTKCGFQDLGGFLAVYGAIVEGDGQSWSIGGLPHTGILGSHNNYEADSSPLKSDLNQYGSNTRLIMSQFQSVCSWGDIVLPRLTGSSCTTDSQMLPPRTTISRSYVTSVERDTGSPLRRTHTSLVSTRPSSRPRNVLTVKDLPFGGIAVSQAAFTFIYRFMSNKSAENPEGILNKAVLKSFMSIQGPENNVSMHLQCSQILLTSIVETRSRK